LSGLKKHHATSQSTLNPLTSQRDRSVSNLHSTAEKNTTSKLNVKEQNQSNRRPQTSHRMHLIPKISECTLEDNRCFGLNCMAPLLNQN
jgi:hypothetical protein